MRVRPPRAESGSSAVSVRLGAVEVRDRGLDRSWPFQRTLGSTSSQEDVAEAVGIKKIAVDAVDGQSSCVMCYGATGAGKTFTMMGPEHSRSPQSRHAGLISRCLAHLLECRAGDTAITATIRVSAVDVYNENVYDLLDAETPRLAVREAGGSFFVAGAAWRTVEAASDIATCVRDIAAHRVVSSHSMNAESSRSHAVVTIMVDAEKPVADVDTKAVVVLVDLAGSEKRKQTGTTGVAAEESAAINTSLLALNRCVLALSASASASVAPRGVGAGAASMLPPSLSSVYVPFRASVLTRLLQAVLSGTAYLALVACIAPEEDQVEHSVATLNYASRASGIRSRPATTIQGGSRGGEHLEGAADARELAGRLREARKEVAALRAENAALRHQLLSAGIEPAMQPAAAAHGMAALASTSAASMKKLTSASSGEPAQSANALAFGGCDDVPQPRVMTSMSPGTALARLAKSQLQQQPQPNQQQSRNRRHASGAVPTRFAVRRNDSHVARGFLPSLPYPELMCVIPGGRQFVGKAGRGSGRASLRAATAAGGVPAPGPIDAHTGEGQRATTANADTEHRAPSQQMAAGVAVSVHRSSMAHRALEQAELNRQLQKEAEHLDALSSHFKTPRSSSSAGGQIGAHGPYRRGRRRGGQARMQPPSSPVAASSEFVFEHPVG